MYTTIPYSMRLPNFFEAFGHMFSESKTMTVQVSYGDKTSKKFVIFRDFILPVVANSDSFYGIPHYPTSVSVDPLLQIRLFWDIDDCCIKLHTYMLEDPGRLQKMRFIKGEYEHILEEYNQRLEAAYQEDMDKIADCYSTLTKEYEILHDLLTLLNIMTIKDENTKVYPDIPITTWNDVHSFILILKQLEINFSSTEGNWDFFFDRCAESPGLRHLTSAFSAANGVYNGAIVSTVKNKATFGIKLLKTLGIATTKIDSPDAFTEPKYTFILDHTYDYILNPDGTTNSNAKSVWRCVVQLMGYLRTEEITLIRGQTEMKMSVFPSFRCPSECVYLFTLMHWHTKKALKFIRAFCDKDYIDEVIIGTHEMDVNTFSLLSDFESKGADVGLVINRAMNDDVERGLLPRYLEFRITDKPGKAVAKAGKINITVNFIAPTVEKLPAAYWGWFRMLTSKNKESKIAFYVNSAAGITEVLRAAEKEKFTSSGTRLLLSRYVAEALDPDLGSFQLLSLSSFGSLEFHFGAGNKMERRLHVSPGYDIDELIRWMLLWEFKAIDFHDMSQYQSFKKKAEEDVILRGRFGFNSTNFSVACDWEKKIGHQLPATS